jgi:hypothetical protein
MDALVLCSARQADVRDGDDGVLQRLQLVGPAGLEPATYGLNGGPDLAEGVRTVNPEFQDSRCPPVPTDRPDSPTASSQFRLPEPPHSRDWSRNSRKDVVNIRYAEGFLGSCGCRHAVRPYLGLSYRRPSHQVAGTASTRPLRASRSRSGPRRSPLPRIRGREDRESGPVDHTRTRSIRALRWLTEDPRSTWSESGPDCAPVCRHKHAG